MNNMSDIHEDLSIKQSKMHDSEDDVKIPLLFNNFEGFQNIEDVQSVNIVIH